MVKTVTNIQVTANDTVAFYNGTDVVMTLSQIMPPSVYIDYGNTSIVIYNQASPSDEKTRFEFPVVYIQQIGANTYPKLNSYALQTEITARVLETYKDLTTEIFKGCCDCAGSSGGLKYGTASGTNTYAVTISGVTGYTDGDTYVVKFTNGNDDDSTININGLGVKTLVKEFNVQLTGGDIVSGQELIIIYDGTNFQTLGVAPNQLFAYVTNADSVTITKGQPVYAFGSAGNRMSVKLAYNTLDATSAQTVGVVFSTSIAAGQKGFIITQGVISGVNTGAYSVGNQLYLGATAGTLTATKPYAPNHLVYIGIVERANAGNGQIYIKPQNGYELDELHDVDLKSVGNTPVNNDVLTYVTGTNNLWKPRSIGTILGYTPANSSTTISTTSPLSGGGDLSANRTLSIAQATTSTDGYLSSTDWNTFNGKQAALVSGTNIKSVNSTSLLGSGNISVGTVTSVSGTGTTAGLSLSGTVTGSGNLTLGGTLSTPVSTINDSTTVGQNIVKLANPSAISYLKIAADNTVSAITAAQLKTDLGIPSGTTFQLVTTSDQASNTTAAIVVSDITGLTFPITSGKRYKFKALLLHTASSTFVGIRIGINANVGVTSVNQQICIVTTPSGSPVENRFNLNSGGVVTFSGANSTAQWMSTVEGILIANNNGTAAIQFSKGAATSGTLTIKAGSILEYFEI